MKNQVNEITYIKDCMECTSVIQWRKLLRYINCGVSQNNNGSLNKSFRGHRKLISRPSKGPWEENHIEKFKMIFCLISITLTCFQHVGKTCLLVSQKQKPLIDHPQF